MGETSDDSKRCRWPDCDCYSPIGPHTCRKAAPVTPMTDKAPERIGLHLTQDDDAPGHYLGAAHTAYIGKKFAVDYVPATALDAAQARIAVLEDKLELERALSDGAHRRARNARAEALDEAAKVADDHLPKDMWESRDSSAQYNLACRHIAAAIRALKGDKNG